MDGETVIPEEESGENAEVIVEPITRRLRRIGVDKKKKRGVDKIIQDASVEEVSIHVF